jgi:hypothetical protein
VTVATSNPGEGVQFELDGTPLDSLPLTFTPLDWDSPQPVRVIAVDDLLVEATPHTDIVTHSTTSADAPYNGLGFDLTVEITDNDVEGGECVLTITTPDAFTVARVGETVSIEWATQDCASLVSLSLRNEAGPCEDIAASVPNTGSFEWTVTGCPEDRLPTDGFRVEVREIDGVASALSRPFIIAPAPVLASETAPPARLSRYELWSLPVQPDGVDPPQLSEVMTDVFGGQELSDLTWLGFGFEADVLTRDPQIEFGRGYWINTTIPVSPEIGIDGSVPAAGKLALEPGWHIIGTPGTEPVSTTSLRIEHPDGRRLRLEEADSLITVAFFDWVDDEGDLINNGRWVAEGVEAFPLVLDPFEGRMMEVKESCRFVFGAEPPDDGGLARPARAPDPLSWTLTFSVTRGRGADGGIVIGSSPHGTRGRDIYDLPKPPLPGDTVSLSISHSDWPEAPGQYLRSITSDEDRDARWLLRGVGGAESATLRWRGVNDLPADRHAYLQLAPGVIVSLSEVTEIEIDAAATFEVELLVMDTEWDGGTFVSGVSEIRRVFPSPSRSGPVTVSYQIVSPVSRASLSIYDIQGRLVRAFNDLPRTTGVWQIEWDGRNESDRSVGAGVYLLDLRLGRESRTTRHIRLP